MLLLCLSYKFELSENKDRIGFMVQNVIDSKRSECASFAQERCKRLATVNEVNPLFLRKYSAKLMTASKASAFALRKSSAKY